ncbi:hypothetical protein ACPPVV_15920 [Rhodanobacter sp. Col0626]|uniref:hypothetical protein n=1 Tax=Rhodanobacter sp. Col0626 TaxID=3415679 RepID=UPI003CF2AD55
MNESRGTAPENGDGSNPSEPAALDWRMVAEQRLGRLVDIEHDHAVIRDRLELLQVDYREILVANTEQLQRISGLDRERRALTDKLADMERSHSWRLTQPLRAVSTWSGGPQRRVGNLMRALLRIRVVRRGARFIVRWTPGLRERLRSKLYAQAGLPDRGNFH